MTIDDACVSCIINQSVRVANAIHASAPLTEELKSTVTKMSESFSYEETPPEIASYVYEEMARIAQKKDLYDEVKALSTKKALSFVGFFKRAYRNLSRQTSYSYKNSSSRQRDRPSR